MNRLLNKVAIITGAAGGICHKASELFCQEGAKVIMVDIDPMVEEFCAKIVADGGEAVAVVADVAVKQTWVDLQNLAVESSAPLTSLLTAQLRSLLPPMTGQPSLPK